MPSPINRAMGATEWFLLIALAILWGGSFFLAAVALVELRPLSVVLGRVGIAAIALNLLVLATGRRMPRGLTPWGAFFAMGLLNNLIPFSLIFAGQTQIASGLASILNATTPLFTVVLAHFLTRDERLSTTRFGGVLAGILGVAVMIGPVALAGLSLDLMAQLACLVAALSYAFAGIFGRRFHDQPPLVTACGQVTATTAMMLPLALAIDQPWTLPGLGGATIAAMLGLALLSTALAYVVYFRVLASAGATNLLLVTFLIPVSALFLGLAVLGERLDPRHFAGMVLIALGLAAIDGRAFAWLKSGP